MLSRSDAERRGSRCKFRVEGGEGSLGGRGKILPRSSSASSFRDERPAPFHRRTFASGGPVWSRRLPLPAYIRDPSLNLAPLSIVSQAQSRPLEYRKKSKYAAKRKYST